MDAGGFPMNKSKKEVPKPELDEDLEDALEATFPASDPIHIASDKSAKPDRPVERRPAKIDKGLVDKLAREVEKDKGAA
jgi:hypothetical protein